MRTGFTSIIITTCGDHLEDCLRPCLTSLIPNTDLTKSEIIIVANGCKKETKEYVESLGIYHKLLWYEDLIGYPRALNVGIEAAEGEFIVLLNDDTEIYQNTWIQILMAPFSDPSVGITGPIKLSTHFDANRFFLINFCVMLKREVFDKVGPFDELFSPGAGEDTDFCLKAVDAGYKLVQVPEESKLDRNDNKSVMVGSFPIYHRGEATLPYLPGIPYSESQAKNRKLLEERYVS